MPEDDFRPRISFETHKRTRKHYFDDNVDFSNVYENLIKIAFNEEGEMNEWYTRAEALAEQRDISVPEALNKVMVSVVDSEGKFKAGAETIYARNDSIGE